jgi:Uma2 family endonuclease
VSKAEYWAIYYDHIDASYEWNNGYLEAKPWPTRIQLALYHWFFDILHRYLKVYPNAQMIALETGFSMTIPDPANPGRMKETIRKPDLGVIRNDNPVPWGDDERSYAGICDLCIEALSDSTPQEIERDTEVKKAEYEFAGVQEYYILDPSAEHLHFYRRTAAGVYAEMAPDAEGVIRSEVLPGFQFRLVDLQRQPDLEELAKDEVYQGYILLDYQASVAQAEEERMRAEAEAAARKVLEEELGRVQAELARLRGDTT